MAVENLPFIEGFPILPFTSGIRRTPSIYHLVGLFEPSFVVDDRLSPPPKGEVKEDTHTHKVDKKCHLSFVHCNFHIEKGLELETSSKSHPGWLSIVTEVSATFLLLAEPPLNYKVPEDPRWNRDFFKSFWTKVRIDQNVWPNKVVWRVL